MSVAFLRRAAAWLFWPVLATVTTLAWLPGRYVRLPFNIWDKAQHASAFVALGALALLGWPRRPGWLIVLLLTLHGCLIEIVQAFVGRDCDWRDVVADLCGLLIVWAILARFRNQAVAGGA